MKNVTEGTDVTPEGTTLWLTMSLRELISPTGHIIMMMSVLNKTDITQVAQHFDDGIDIAHNAQYSDD